MDAITKSERVFYHGKLHVRGDVMEIHELDYEGLVRDGVIYANEDPEAKKVLDKIEADKKQQEDLEAFAKSKETELQNNNTSEENSEIE